MAVLTTLGGAAGDRAGRAESEQGAGAVRARLLRADRYLRCDGEVWVQANFLHN